MVQLVLNQENFKNNKFLFSYGDREALFTIIGEEFAGHNRLGKINRLTILVRNIRKGTARLCTTIIGLSDGTVGIRTEDPLLRGKPMTKDNMQQCVIELSEDSDI